MELLDEETLSNFIIAKAVFPSHSSSNNNYFIKSCGLSKMIYEVRQSYTSRIIQTNLQQTVKDKVDAITPLNWKTTL